MLLKPYLSELSEAALPVRLTISGTPVVNEIISSPKIYFNPTAATYQKISFPCKYGIITINMNADTTLPSENGIILDKFTDYSSTTITVAAFDKILEC